MCYFYVSCLLSTIILSINLYLFYVSVRASVQLEIHSLGNTNTITDVRVLKVTTFYFIFKLLPLLYMIEKYDRGHKIRHMRAVRSISRLIYGKARLKAFNVEGFRASRHLKM